MTSIWTVLYRVTQSVYVQDPSTFGLFGPTGCFLHPGEEHNLNLVGYDESQIRNKFRNYYAEPLGKAEIVSVKQKIG